MKHFLKGAAAVVITMMVSMVINVFCNMHGIDLNATAATAVWAICAVSIYRCLIRNEKNKES